MLLVLKILFLTVSSLCALAFAIRLRVGLRLLKVHCLSLDLAYLRQGAQKAYPATFTRLLAWLEESN
jgi:hypothetical protein